jgi:eukaryotic-like serine/threonine-protein kinase
MITKCQHCRRPVEVELSPMGGLFRCALCRKLNILLKTAASGAVVFKDCEILQEVGQGANAVVCKARRPIAPDDIFALKLFLFDHSVDSHATREFFRESDFLVRVEHQNIVRIIAGGEVNGIPFLEMEFVDGINMAQYMDRYGAMNQFEAFTVGSYVALALDYVWSNYLMVHRDIKPQNIMIDKQGHVKVCDFGMVTAHEMAGVDLDAIEGTPYYLSPESISESANTYQDNRSDIYSLGTTLYHLIAGSPPFDYDTVVRVITARAEEEAPDIREVQPEVHEHVALVLQTMMARDPEDRYVTANECLQDMLRVKRGEKPLLVDRSRPRINQ